MTQSSLRRVGVAFALAIGGAVLSAQQTLPSSPAKGFGGGITPAFEGWFDNPDGTHNFLIGYYSRNTKAEVDIPLGANNRFDTPNPDQGQPTHFLTRRRFGMFMVTVPKDFPQAKKIYWTLTADGKTNTVPFHMHTDYNITPHEVVGGEPDARIQHAAEVEARAERSDLHRSVRDDGEGDRADCDGRHADAARAVRRRRRAIQQRRQWADERVAPAPRADRLEVPGPRHDHAREQRSAQIRDSLGRQAARVRISGKATTTVKFSEPGDYVLHVNINDYSGNGGGGSGCCWTTLMMKVAVK